MHLFTSVHPVQNCTLVGATMAQQCMSYLSRLPGAYFTLFGVGMCGTVYGIYELALVRAYT